MRIKHRKLTEMQVLMEVREKLSELGTWTQWTAARDAAGWPCNPHGDDACSWCLTGAFRAVTGGFWNPAMDVIWMELKPIASSIADWNDEIGRTHTEVLNLLDRLIEREK